MALPTFWAIDRTCSSKIDGVVAQSLDTDVQRPFYSVATVALLPY